MLVSVYITTRNRVELLKRAVQSVQRQTLADWELLIVDDASSDETWSYLKTVEASEKRVKIFRYDEQHGPCRARNLAIEKASGVFVTGLDDDDEFLPTRLTELLNAYEETYSFVCSGYYWVTDDGARPVMCSDKIITLSAQLDTNEASNQIFTTKQRWLKIGGFDPSFPALQDYDCFTRMIEVFGPAKRIGQPLQNIYVSHEQQRISNSLESRLGFDLFMEKHSDKMTERNRLNHQFWKKYRFKEPISFLELLRSIPAGFALKKIKHYFSVR